MKVQPLGNHVLVRPEPQADKSKGGILIPDNAKEKPQVGLVVEVGPGRASESLAGGVVPMTIKKGQKVLYQRYAGNSIKDLGEDLLMTEDDILAIVE